jgi:hypothetical protein
MLLIRLLNKPPPIQSCLAIVRHLPIFVRWEFVLWMVVNRLWGAGGFGQRIVMETVEVDD